MADLTYKSARNANELVPGTAGANQEKITGNEVVGATSATDKNSGWLFKSINQWATEKRQIFDVTDYSGATFADQLQAAIDAAAAVGATVYIPAGRYTVTKSVRLKHGVDILGAMNGPEYNTTPPAYCAGASIQQTANAVGTILVADAAVTSTLEFFVANEVDRANPVGGPEPISVRLRSLGFYQGKSIVRCGAKNSYGFGYGTVIEDIFIDSCAGAGLILYNFQGLAMQRVQGNKVFGGIHAVQQHSDCQNGNSIWSDLFFDVSGTTPPFGIKFEAIHDAGGSSCTGNNCEGNAFNFMTVIRPQVNFFGVSTGEACLILEGVKSPLCPVNGFNLVDVDVEGNTNYGIKIINSQNSTITTKGLPNAPTNADIQCIDSDQVAIECHKADAIIDIDTASVIELKGYAGSFPNQLPISGRFYLATEAKSLICAVRNRFAMEFHAPSNSYGPTNVGQTVGSETWMAQRLLMRRSAYALTTTQTIGNDRMGFYECRNTTNIVITLPLIGDLSAQARVGVPIVFDKRDGAGTVTIQGSGSDTVGFQSNFILPSTPGGVVALISSGPNNASGPGNWALIQTPELQVPPGGTEGQIIVKNSATEQDAGWQDIPIAFPVSYDYDNNTTKADPGTGQFRMDSSAISTTTNFYVSNITKGGVPLDEFPSIGQGTLFKVTQVNKATRTGIFEVQADPVSEGGGTWWSIAVQNKATGSIDGFQSGREIAFEFFGIGSGGVEEAPPNDRTYFRNGSVGGGEADWVTLLKGYGEVVDARGNESAGITYNADLYNRFTSTINGGITALTLSTTMTATSIMLTWTISGTFSHVLTAVDWGTAGPPTMTSGKTYRIGLFTENTGTNWQGVWNEF